MNREERIAWARKKAAESAPVRAEEQAKQDAANAADILALGTDAASRAAQEIDRDDSIAWLGSVAMPQQWAQAVAAARQVAITAAQAGRTITYGELRVAAYRATGMKVGYSTYAQLAMSVNDKRDGCLLSAIIVQKDTGMPGDGFVPYARREGFDEPVAALQRRVYEHFGDTPDT